MTGPVSLDLADVIAQMAFRPRAARLARAVRNQLAAVHLAEQQRKVANVPMPDAINACSHRSTSSQNGQHAMGGGYGADEKPSWQGPLDNLPKAPPIFGRGANVASVVTAAQVAAITSPDAACDVLAPSTAPQPPRRSFGAALFGGSSRLSA